MKIVIVGSVNFSDKLIKIGEQLEKLGHEIELPTSTKKIRDGEISLKEYIAHKEKNGDQIFRQKHGKDLIKNYHRLILESDAILVVNLEKNRIENYIGGNGLMEIAFAYVLDKKIFLLNPIPEMSYTDEIIAMKPVVINSDLTKIK